VRNHLLRSWMMGLAIAATACSESSDSTDESGGAGAPAATGGETASGGASAQGGSPTGGVATGGVDTGGATSGGTTSTGGRSVGGRAAVGGATGGSTDSGGVGASGGTAGTGGSDGFSGASTTGGRSAVGGRSGSGGTNTAGGAASTGGSGDSGGASATGGSGSPGMCGSGPLSEPLPDCAPTPVPDTGDYYADCVARINQLRWECQCLPPLDRWPEGEACADQHAQYDYEHDEAHAGFSARICENGGSAQNECPGYGARFGIIDFCLQQMWDEGPGEPYSAHGHYINMTDSAYSKVACGRYETPNGDVWAVQNFSR
jgi:hypothetical protein